MKAKFVPKRDYHESILNKAGLICEWEFAYSANGINYYTTTDKKFYSTDSYSEDELIPIK